MSSVSTSGNSTPQVASDNPRWSPYPGLRPFQPDDSEYFYGRDLEVDQVMARLRDKRFVAVIGGSGSGKSSLVLAGAIPRLRSFAIKNAGDFWAPVVATPGTNHVDGDSPIRRLARKFCGELVDSVDAAVRLEECVTLLRSENGLGRLVERFGGELKGCDGLSLDKLQVNFLFLLDQFEELFHPSNARETIAEDCRELVDRIVEQFKSPHPQVCVALTMRSEHLNDCPRYEELPDAINGTSFLVKRLGTEQLRDAIEQPVLRYLRKRVAEQRSARRQARLEGREAVAVPVPDRIPIDADLIERLLVDSTAVLAEQDHADHLPLLQHLLFWIWQEASARCEGKPQVDALTLDDLWRAVGPMPGAQVQPLDASINTLEACLENRCDGIFCRHEAEQGVWEAAFRSLPFKEPNTGTYTQQRASMTDLGLHLGVASGDNATLALHLQPWLQPHGYLHWDVDSRTVKVAHETLIRRWQRFRHWIDEEDRQFHVYLRLLEDCERWKEEQRSEWALSGGDTLRRYEDEQLPVILKDPTRLARIHRLLGMDRDGLRLATVTSDAVQFLDLSIESRSNRERERKRDEDQRRLAFDQLAQSRRDNDVQRAKNAELESRTAAQQEKTLRVRWKLGLAVMAVFILIPLAGWSVAVYVVEKQVSTKERTLHRSYALAAESQVGFKPQFKDMEGPQDLLRYALIGSHFFGEGRQLPTGPAHWPLVNRYYAERLDALHNSDRFSEARNTDSLRTILQGGVWTIQRAASDLAKTADQRCRTVQLGSNGDGIVPAQEAYFFERPGANDRRGLILDVGTVDVSTLSAAATVSVGRFETSSGSPDNCVIEQQLMSTPPQPLSMKPARVGIASDTSNIVIAFSGYTQFYSVKWDSPTRVSTRPRAVASSELKDDFRNGGLLSIPKRFWTDVVLGSTTVRLFNLEPSVFSDAEAKMGQELKKLGVTETVAVCKSFAKTHDIDLEKEAVWELRTLDSDGRDGRDYCLRVTPSRDSTNSTVYSASLYRLNATAAAGAKEKDLAMINQLPLGASVPVEFRLNEADGWMAFSDGRAWRAVPWSLDAFRAMAIEVFKPDSSASSASTASLEVRAVSAMPAGKRQGCGRPADDPQFNLPYNLILGDLHCPTDAALKAMARIVPLSRSTSR